MLTLSIYNASACVRLYGYKGGASSPLPPLRRRPTPIQQAKLNATLTNSNHESVTRYLYLGYLQL